VEAFLFLAPKGITRGQLSIDIQLHVSVPGCRPIDNPSTGMKRQSEIKWAQISFFKCIKSSAMNEVALKPGGFVSE
jgi:hypothetical protein